MQLTANNFIFYPLRVRFLSCTILDYISSRATILRYDNKKKTTQYSDVLLRYRIAPEADGRFNISRPA